LQALLKKIAPEIERHASTQMTVHNDKHIEYLIESNFSRVVLARELPIEEVKRLSEKYPQIGFEVFAHGALCYSYSGQCLLSSMIGGRSGNRGDCAGPCRLPYRLYREGNHIETKGNYLLSTKDLCTVKHIEEFIDANISAIKIEGRMKRPEYVYSVVSEYRKAIDTLKVNEASINHLKSAFNRGFTKGLIFNESPDNFMGVDRPDNRGELVATINKKNNAKHIVALTNLNKGDLLAYRQEGITKTYKLDNDIAKGAVFTLPKVEVSNDLEVTRVKNVKGDRVISDDMRRPVAKYKLDINITLIEGQPIKIDAKDSVDNQVYLESEYILPKAHTTAASKDYVIKQISKLGGTLWEARDINVKIVGQPAAPSKILNQLRRTLVESLLESQREKFQLKVVNSPKIVSVDSVVKRSERETKLAVSADNLAEAKAALQNGADYIYFGSEKELSYFSQDLLEAKKLLGDKFVWRLPRITQTKSLDAYLSMFEKLNPKAVYTDNLGQIYGLKDKSVKVISGSGLFVMNSLSAKELNSLGVDEITLSVELNKGQIEDLLNNFDGKVNLVVGEKTLLMIHQSCILKGINQCVADSCQKTNFYLKDRLDYMFDLGFDDKCRSYLYNSQDLSLIDHLDEIINMNIDTITLDLSGRGEVIVKELTDIYAKALVETKNLGKINVSEYKERIQAVVGNQLTRGHWHRGV